MNILVVLQNIYKSLSDDNSWVRYGFIAKMSLTLSASAVPHNTIRFCF